MKLLLDENIPRKLKYRFPNNYSVSTVPEKNWSGIKNGDLLKQMQTENLKILISIDKNFSNQQNLSKFSISLIVLNAKDNRYETLLKFIPKLITLLENPMAPGSYNLEL